MTALYTVLNSFRDAHTYFTLYSLISSLNEVYIETERERKKDCDTYLQRWNHSAGSRDSVGPSAAVVDTVGDPVAAADRHVRHLVAPPTPERG